MDGIGESNCFRSRSNTWPKNPELDGRNNLGRKYIYGNQTYADLIEKAIEASPERRLSLSEIYQWLADNVPHFKNKSISPLSWKNSVRHNLSLHGKFLRVQVDRKSLWTINPNPSEAKNGRKRVYQGNRRNKRQTKCEHSYCNNGTHYKKEARENVSTSNNNSTDQHQQIQPECSYFPQIVDKVSQESLQQNAASSTVHCHSLNQRQPITQLTDSLMGNTFPVNIKQEVGYPDYSFRSRSYSSSSSVSRSSLASSVDEAAANIDWPGAKQRMPTVAAYFSSFRPKPDLKHEQKSSLFAESGQNSLQLATNLELRTEIVLPGRIMAEYDKSDTSFSFRPRSCSYSNDQHSKFKAVRTPKIHLQDVPYSKNFVEVRRPYSPRLPLCSKKLSQISSVAIEGRSDTWSPPQTQSYATSETRSPASSHDFTSEAAHGTCLSPRLYIQDDPKARHLTDHFEPFRQRSNSNPSSRYYGTAQDYRTVSKFDHQLQIMDLNTMQPFRPRTDSNPLLEPITGREDIGRNRYLSETMSPRVEQSKPSDHVLSSDFSNINLEPLSFQGNMDIGNIIKHELNIDGILDFS